MNKTLARVRRAFAAALQNPKLFARQVDKIPYRYAAEQYARDYRDRAAEGCRDVEPQGNPLWDYFQSHAEGQGKRIQISAPRPNRGFSNLAWPNSALHSQ